MEDKLFLNTKLYGGFKGIIGRRDYFLNCIYIYSISLFFTLPYTVYIFSKIGNIDIFNPSKCFSTSPILIQIWFILGILITCILAISNIYRRINDIQGSTDKKFPIIVSVFYVIGNFTFLYPDLIGFLFSYTNTVLCLVLLLKTGKITSKYPYDFTKEFNWGAFLGTWIWGLVNKTYITLWTFIIALTPWGIYFALYCGLKGNEWAYKNKKWNDVEKFNKEQEKQTTIFTIIFHIITPVLYFVFMLGFILSMFFALSQPPKTNEYSTDTKSQTIERRLDSIMTNIAEKYFESYEIIEINENKFYINENNWKGYNYTQRKNILDLAASVSAGDKEKMFKKEHGYEKHYSEKSEREKTKIYGSKTKKLLAEYKFDKKPDMKFEDTIKETIKTYRFYEP